MLTQRWQRGNVFAQAPILQGLWPVCVAYVACLCSICCLPMPQNIPSLGKKYSHLGNKYASYCPKSNSSGHPKRCSYIHTRDPKECQSQWICKLDSLPTSFCAIAKVICNNIITTKNDFFLISAPLRLPKIRINSETNKKSTEISARFLACSQNIAYLCKRNQL